MEERGQAELSMHANLCEKIDDSSAVFEMFTLAEYSKNEFTRSRKALGVTTKNRNIPRRTKKTTIAASEI